MLTYMERKFRGMEQACMLQRRVRKMIGPSQHIPAYLTQILACRELPLWIYQSVSWRKEASELSRNLPKALTGYPPLRNIKKKYTLKTKQKNKKKKTEEML